MDTEIRVSTESRPWRRKFSRRSSRDSNPRPFNHESGALTTELSPPPSPPPPGLAHYTTWLLWTEEEEEDCVLELGSCVEVEVDVLGSPYLTVSTVSVAEVQCCFTSTKTIRTVRHGEPRTATSSFTQLLISVDVKQHWRRRRIVRYSLTSFPQCKVMTIGRCAWCLNPGVERSPLLTSSTSSCLKKNLPTKLVPSPPSPRFCRKAPCQQYGDLLKSKAHHCQYFHIIVSVSTSCHYVLMIGNMSIPL